MDLCQLRKKETKYIIGLMSGTSVDGMDAALIQLTGCDTHTRVRQLAFITLPYTAAVEERILQIAGGQPCSSEELCLMSFLLGQLSVEACLAVCREAGLSPEEVDLVGSHGQTVWHAPHAQNYLGYSVRGTLQIGEPSLIAEALGCPVVSDFRVRDMAAGGQGAPLVPYTEYLLYRDPERDIALQNIGGIGNITWLPKNYALSDVFAFDTGPGNMVMNALAFRLTDGKLRFDQDGRLAAKGRVSKPLLQWMLESDPCLPLPPPKTTGREQYGSAYLEALLQQAQSLQVSLADTLSTATAFTAACIAENAKRFLPRLPDRLIVGGGGSCNPTLMQMLRQALPTVEVLRGEDLGLDSNAKEAVAFAVLANEALYGLAGNAPGATGAAHPVVLGKISQ